MLGAFNPLICSLLPTVDGYKTLLSVQTEICMGINWILRTTQKLNIIPDHDYTASMIILKRITGHVLIFTEKSLEKWSFKNYKRMFYVENEWLKC